MPQRSKEQRFHLLVLRALNAEFVFVVVLSPARLERLESAVGKYVKVAGRLAKFAMDDGLLAPVVAVGVVAAGADAKKFTRSAVLHTGPAIAVVMT